MRLSRRHILTSAATLIFLTLGLAIASPWVANRALVHVAQTRDWSVRIDGGRVGWRGIWFTRIALDAKKVATLHAEFAPACVSWSSLFGTRRLSVGSGRIELLGTLDEIRSLLGARDSAGTAGSLGHRGFEYDLHHLDLEWRENADALPQVSIGDLEVTKSDDRLVARAATLLARHGAVAVELKGAVVKPIADEDRVPAVGGHNPAVYVSVAEMLMKYDTSSAAAADAGGQGATHGASAADEKATHTPVASGAHATPKPIAAGVQPTQKPFNPSAPVKADLQKSNAGISAKREFLPLLGWLFDELERLRNELAGSTTDADVRATRWLDKIAIGTRFESSALRIRIVDEGQKLDLGPWPLKAERGEQELSAELSQSATAGKSAVSAKITLADRFESGKLNFAVGPITLPQLGATEGDFGLENIATTQLEIEAHAAFESRTGELSVDSKGWIERLSIRQPYLARETVKNIAFAWEGAVTVDAAKRQLKSDMLRLSTGPVSARLHGALELAEGYQTINGSLEVPLAACQDLFNVLPDGLAPLLRGWRLDRSFALHLSVAFDSRTPNKSIVGFKLDNSCRVGQVPPEVAPSRFEQPFVLDVEDEQGAVQPTSFGPGTWGWTPLGAISPYVESAVLVCEDGGFPYHNGFDRQAIQNSIRENLRTQRFARGASTVSMQLAKNLYLRRDKTIARKLQEAALTMLLEQSFSKRQMLELYLNVIEFGPGIYGIGPAAKHYFETTPDRLTLAQSFFLISLLPSPKPQHFGADGLVRPGRMKLLRSLMSIAQKRGYFSEAELEAGLAEQLAYRVPGNPATAPTHRMLQNPGMQFDDELALPPTDDE